MILVVMNHILGHGGVADATDSLSIRYGVTWLFFVCAFCAVNVYALISGYVGYGRKWRMWSLFQLQFQVWFYTLITTLVFYVIDGDSVSMSDWVSAVFPMRKFYWYFSAYFCLFFFAPFINIVIEKWSQTTVKRLLFSLFLVFSLLPTLLGSDFGKTNDGYSAMWLMILYCLGAYIRKYVDLMRLKKKTLLIGLISSILVTWVSKLVIEYLTTQILGEPKLGNYLVSYTSPTIIATAVILLLLFAGMSVKQSWVRFISFFSPLTFGVYLFHEEPLLHAAFITEHFRWIGALNPILIPATIIGISLFIWLIGSLADKVRTILFKRLNVSALCVWLEEKWETLLNKSGLLNEPAAE